MFEVRVEGVGTGRLKSITIQGQDEHLRLGGEGDSEHADAEGAHRTLRVASHSE